MGDISNLPHVRDTAIISRWRGKLVNTLFDAVRDHGGSTDKRKTSSADQLSWVRCVSDDDVAAYGIVEAYDGRADSGGLVLRVRKSTSGAVAFAGNEQYALTANSPGWVKMLNPYTPVIVSVHPSSGNIAFLGELGIVDTYVKSGSLQLKSLAKWPPVLEWGTGTGTGVLEDDRIPVVSASTGSGAPRIRFTILSTAFSEVLGSIGCDFVNARVNWVSCSSTGVAIGDEVRIFDPELCHWNLPIDLLVGLCGTATSMDSAEFIASRYYIPDCLYIIDGQSCIWMVDTLCCAEEQEIAS